MIKYYTGRLKEGVYPWVLRQPFTTHRSFIHADKVFTHTGKVFVIWRPLENWPYKHALCMEGSLLLACAEVPNKDGFWVFSLFYSWGKRDYVPNKRKKGTSHKQSSM
jgi:hypothetical protein